MSRRREILAGAAALIAGAFVILGIPALLIAGVGWPLPRALPTLAHIGDALAGRAPIDPSVYWRAIACVLWLAWAQVATAVLLEIRSTTTGRLTRPIRGLRRAQAGAAALVATIALLWPTASSGYAAAAPMPAPVAADMNARVELRTAAPSSTQSAPPASSQTIEHVVVRHDSLWSLAERYLGDGNRWQEIFAANHDRPQSDGETLSRPGLLRPGWTLQIIVADPPTDTQSVVVVPGDTLSEIANDRLGDPTRYPEIFEVNRGHPQPDGDALDDVNLIRPGWVLELPATSDHAAAANTAAPVVEPVPSASEELPEPATAEPPSPGAVSAVPTTDVGGTVSPGAPMPSAGDIDHRRNPGGDAAARERGGALDAGILGAAGAVLASGLLAALHLRRRRRRVHRLPGSAPPPVAEAAARVEEAAVLADGELVARIAATLARLATALRHVDPAPWPRLMQVHAGQLEVLLHAPSSNPPTGWRAAADGSIWASELLTPHDTEPEPNDVCATPALVSLGGLDDGGVLLDVEAEGVIGLTGTPDCVDDFARSIAAELVTTPFAHIHAVGVIGVRMPGAEALGIKQYESLADAVEEVRGGAESVAAALDQFDSRSSFELRCRYPDEPWTPTILVIAASSAARERTALDQLLGMAGGGGRGLGLVIAGDAPAGCLEVQVDADEIALPALGLQFRPQLLTVEVADAVAELLESASAEPIPTPTEPMTLFETASLHDDEPQLRVNLLGPIGVEGAAIEIKPQQLAFLAYLALHPEASGDALRDALWGGRPPSQERFLNAIHELRRAIGSAHLPPAVDGRYSLHAITTDAALFETHLARADTNQASMVEATQTALELVTGPPFSYDSRHRRHFTWVDLGNHSSRLERLIADAAHGLAVTALDAGDSHLAAWAGHRGLLACPANETLVGDVMAAHLLAGDTRAAESVLREYERALDELGIEDPPDALYALLERKRAS